MAGLPLSNAWVSVTPPLFCSGPSSGSLVSGALVKVTADETFCTRLLVPPTVNVWKSGLPMSTGSLPAITVLLSVMLPPY